MRKIIVSLLLASSALGVTARANETGPYITLEGGVVKQEHSDVFSGAGYEHTNRFKTGWEAGGALGYDFGHFRLEAEGFYARSLLNDQTRPLGTPLPNGTYVRGAGLFGRTSTVAAMGNALIGLGQWGGIKAYAGAGVGYATTKLSESVPFAVKMNDRAHGFAWQAIAGVTVPLSRTVDLGVKYRYFRPDGADEFIAADGTARTARLRSHALLATLTFNFGGKTEEPEPEAVMPPPPPPAPLPPPPPPPPPPPVAAVCNPGPFIVFFDWDRSDISPEAASVLDNAVQAYGNCGNVGIMLAGHADTSGAPRYNLGLSERRDGEVKSYLTGHGISAGVISSQAYGETKQRVPTADGVREVQNRRVEISYGPGSGF
ncbi:OmpA family protein [Novosphingobium sp. PASSN1]|uniref:OmpA family protein n=1 Tax=Novosphingobium sp. PASSN1 TaxID=2015561 RepID=UPI000BD37A9F|nr:OmpA family protein [Novosphingobium sp. PASSN1]OYU34504.1 MAG: flagellar motor protein MotB [Novosphingobium sp. PASSN1]